MNTVPLRSRVASPLSLVRFVLERPLSPLWIHSFGPYPWFVIPFLGDVLFRNGWRISEVYSKLAPELPNLVPQSWRRSDPWAQWHNLSYPQFKAAVSGDLVRLDKALTSAVLVDSVVNGFMDQLFIVPSFEEVMFDREVDYHLVIPSTFVVDGLDRRSSDEQFLSEIGEAVGQSIHMLKEVARGGAVVEYVAHEIALAAAKLDVNAVEPRLLRDRKDFIRSKQVRPVPYQRLSREKIAKFYDVALPNEEEW